MRFVVCGKRIVHVWHKQQTTVWCACSCCMYTTCKRRMVQHGFSTRAQIESRDVLAMRSADTGWPTTSSQRSAFLGFVHKCSSATTSNSGDRTSRRFEINDGSELEAAVSLILHSRYGGPHALICVWPPNRMRDRSRWLSRRLSTPMLPNKHSVVSPMLFCVRPPSSDSPCPYAPCSLSMGLRCGSSCC